MLDKEQTWGLQFEEWIYSAEVLNHVLPVNYCWFGWPWDIVVVYGCARSSPYWVSVCWMQLPLSLLKTAQGHPMVWIAHSLAVLWCFCLSECAIQKQHEKGFWCDNRFHSMFCNTRLPVRAEIAPLLCTACWTQEWRDLQWSFSQLWYLDEYSSSWSYLHLKGELFCFASISSCLSFFTSQIVEKGRLWAHIVLRWL